MSSATNANAWYHRRDRDPRTGCWRVSCYRSDRFPDGQIAPAPSPEDLAAAEPLWHATTDARGRPVLAVVARTAAMPAAVWYLVVPHPDHDPPTVDLVAFPTRHIPPDTVVDGPTFTMLPVRASEQIGAIRWWPDSAVVDQVFVDPARRRSQLATRLVYAASAYHQHRGWPGRLHSDGRRTHLGDRFAVALRHPARIAPWTVVSDPMDPPGPT